MIVRVVVYVIAAAAAALAVATISEQRLIAYDSQGVLAIFALILGSLNATVVPILRVLTLPLSCLTFGLFSVVLNAAVFALAAALTVGMTVSFWGAVLGAILTSVAGGVIFSLVDER